MNKPRIRWNRFVHLYYCWSPHLPYEPKMPFQSFGSGDTMELAYRRWLTAVGR